MKAENPSFLIKGINNPVFFGLKCIDPKYWKSLRDKLLLEPTYLLPAILCVKIYIPCLRDLVLGLPTNFTNKE